MTTYPHGDTDDLAMSLWFIKFNWLRLPAVSHFVDPDFLVNERGPGFDIPAGLASGYDWAR